MNGLKPQFHLSQIDIASWNPRGVLRAGETRGHEADLPATTR